MYTHTILRLNTELAAIPRKHLNCDNHIYNNSDIDECSETTDKALCGVNSQCINTVGSYECVCATGYALVNGNCECM